MKKGSCGWPWVVLKMLDGRIESSKQLCVWQFDSWLWISMHDIIRNFLARLKCRWSGWSAAGNFSTAWQPWAAEINLAVENLNLNCFQPLFNCNLSWQVWSYCIKTLVVCFLSPGHSKEIYSSHRNFLSACISTNKNWKDICKAMIAKLRLRANGRRSVW